MKIKAVVWKTIPILLEMHISKQRKEKQLLDLFVLTVKADANG